MSAKSSKNDAATSNGMKGFRGLHPGMIPCYRSEARHAKYRWGKKKGTRRARRRIDKEIIKKEVEE